MLIIYISILFSIILFIFSFITHVVRWVNCGNRMASLLPALFALGYNDLAKECQEHIKKYGLEAPRRGDIDRAKADNKLAKKICKIEVVGDDEGFKILRKYQLIIKFYRLGVYSCFLSYTIFILGVILSFMGY